MPGTFRYSASLDKTYRDEETGLIRSTGDLSSQNGDHTRTCSMDSLDSISSSGGSLAGSSINGSAGAHSRQVSTDSTSSPTNFISPNSYVNTRIPPSNAAKASHNPHQFIKAGPSVLHKTASEQIKVVKEVKTFRAPVKEDEEEWQQNLCSWKSKRRVKSETTFQRVDEMKQLETVNDSSESPKRKSKTFSQMCKDKARRPSYNLSLYSDISQETSDSEKKDINEENTSENNISKSKNHDSSFDDNGSNQLIYDNSIKDKDDGYSSKDECNKTETDDQSDTAANDDQIPMMTESSGVGDHEILQTYTTSVVETFQETTRDADCSSTTSTSVTNSSEEEFPSTAFHESDYATDELIEETQSANCLNENSNGILLHSDSELLKVSQSESEIILLTLALKPNIDIKDFGFTMKGGNDYSPNVFVESVTPNGAAEKAGVMVNDVIKTINGEETYNRSHSALVFAVKQAGYTGQLHLGVVRTSAPEDMVIMNDIQSSPKPKSAKAFQEKRAIFLQKEEDNRNLSEVSPSRDSVARRRSLFDGLASQEASKKSVNVDVRLSLQDRVASFENVGDSAFKKYNGHGSLDNINKTPPVVKPKPKFVSTMKASSTEHIKEILDKEDVLSKPDLIESNVDSKSDSEDHLSDSDANQEPGEEKIIVKERVTCDSHNAFDNSYLIPISDDIVESPKEFDRPENVETAQEFEFKNEIQSESSVLESTPEKASAEEHVYEEFQKNSVEFPEDRLEQLCYNLSESSNANMIIHNSVFEYDIEPRLNESSENQISTLDMQVSGENDFDKQSVEDVSDALEEALALIDDSVPAPDKIKINDSSYEAKSSAPVDSDLNVIYDSNSLQTFMSTNLQFDDLLSNNEFLLDDNFDRPRSIAEPPKEKPPPPPVETSPQNIPPMKRLNSTKRIKKEILKRRSDFLGLGDQADDTVDIDEIVPKPPRQIDDLLRSELEMEKSLQSPTLSFDYSDPSIESPYESKFEQSHADENLNLDDNIELKMQEEEEKRIRELEEQRIQMQEARRRAEEERLLQERVEQMRKQQEMLTIEKERLKREQNEVMKTRTSSESSTGSTTNMKSNAANAIPMYNRSKNRPRVPPPPPPKPMTKEAKQPTTPEERGRSEVIRLSKRPTSGDFSGIDLCSGSSVGQPIQKQPLSRHSLQSLSAVPKANLSNSDSHWMKREAAAARRRSDVPRRDTYSHWLIQEAEMRRIAEHSERKRIDKQNGNNRMDFPSSLTNSKSESNIAHSGNSNKFIPDSVMDTLTSRVNKINDSHQPLDKSPSSNHDWSPQYQMARSKSTEMNNYGPSTPELVGPTSNYGHYNSDKVHNSPPMHAYYQNLSSSVHCAVNNSNYVDIDVAGDQIGRSQHSYHDLSKSASGKGQDNMLSVSGRKKCSNCLEELGRGAAMIIESLKLFYHIKCFRCSVCQVQLGNGSCGADVRVRNHKLHCQNCYSNDEAGLKFSKV